MEGQDMNTSIVGSSAAADDKYSSVVNIAAKIEEMSSNVDGYEADTDDTLSRRRRSVNIDAVGFCVQPR